MASLQSFVRCRIGELDFALPLASVERVVRAAAVSPLPGAPAAILGMLVVHGEVVAVANMRERFGLPARALAPDDHLVIARTPRRRLAIVVDAAHEVVQCDGDEVLASERVVPGLEHVHGVVRTPDGLLLVHDLDRFLAVGEEAALTEALERG